jgi:hypothetical protein
VVMLVENMRVSVYFFLACETRVQEEGQCFVLWRGSPNAKRKIN